MYFFHLLEWFQFRFLFILLYVHFTHIDYLKDTIQKNLCGQALKPTLKSLKTISATHLVLQFGAILLVCQNLISFKIFYFRKYKLLALTYIGQHL
uniref:Uncharacterized protein n=1 Tax=Octopus bimaculoides TaxID=37653 RepID=A0A0L8GAJ9_OCTBM